MPVKKPKVEDSGANELKKLSDEIAPKKDKTKKNDTDDDANIDTNDTTDGDANNATGADSVPSLPGIDTNNDETKNADENSELNLTELGRVYTLKRIYSILKSLNTYVDDALIKYNNEPNLVKIKTQVVNMQDLFVLLSSNIEKYTDKLEEIISSYNEYIITVTKLLSTNYSLDEENDFVLNDEHNTAEMNTDVEQNFKSNKIQSSI